MQPMYVQRQISLRDDMEEVTLSYRNRNEERSLPKHYGGKHGSALKGNVAEIITMACVCLHTEERADQPTTIIYSGTDDAMLRDQNSLL